MQPAETASVFSAIAALGSFATAAATYWMARQQYQDSARPDVLPTSWDIGFLSEDNIGLVRQDNGRPAYLVLGQLQNVGKGPAYDIAVLVRHVTVTREGVHVGNFAPWGTCIHYLGVNDVRQGVTLGFKMHSHAQSENVYALTFKIRYRDSFDNHHIKTYQVSYYPQAGVILGSVDAVAPKLCVTGPEYTCLTPFRRRLHSSSYGLIETSPHNDYYPWS
jgi:hypothetical protein